MSESVIEVFPGLTEKHYFQHDETKEFWFHATGVCNELGFSNPSSAVQLHTDEDERFREVLHGRDTWFVSEAGVWGLILASKSEKAIAFKRKLKHEILPKLRASGVYIASTATSESIKEAIEAHFVKKDRETELIIRNVEKHFQVTENYLTGKSSYLSNIWKRGTEIEKQWAGEILRDTERREAVSKILKDSIVKLYQVCSNGKRNETVLGKILESIKPL